MSDATKLRLSDALFRPVHPGSVVALRVAVGLLGAFGAARFLWKGWVDRFFVQPTNFLPYWGFGGVDALPSAAMHGVFAALVVLGLAVAIGLRTRLSAAAFLALFVYVEVIDITNYLNHYVLLSWLMLLLALLPHPAWGSLDGWLEARAGRRERHAVDALPLWVLGLFRLQIACVYFFAGVAKLNPDWLLHGQPLNIWLSARTELPLLGAFFDEWWVALAFSWAGFLFDTTIVAFLLWRRTRPVAYLAVLAFHGMTHVLFTIGLFPLIMVCCATIFFEPDWPMRWLPGRREVTPRAGAGAAWGEGGGRRAVLAGCAVFAALHLAMPLRTHLYVGAGPVAWHEQGMRYSWRVMLREKSGDVMFKVTHPGGRDEYVPPSRYLTTYQEREMSGQPDVILQLAHRIADDVEAETGARPEVRAEAWVSWNGRRPAQLIDPDVDLAAEPRGLARRDWILAPPADAPPHLRPLDGAP